MSTAYYIDAGWNEALCKMSGRSTHAQVNINKVLTTLCLKKVPTFILSVT